MLTIEFTDKAISSISKIGNKIAGRILAKLYWLAEHPDPHSVLVSVKNPPTELAGISRLRIGDYRVILWLEDSTITIYDIGFRSEVYKALGRN